MEKNKKFELVKKKVATNIFDSGLDIFLFGYVIYQGEETLLLRAYKDEEPIVNMYTPGNIFALKFDAFKNYGKVIGKIHCHFMENREELEDIAYNMDEDFINAVTFAEDLKIMPILSNDENIKSVTDFRAFLPSPPAVNKIMSYQNIYSGNMYDFVTFMYSGHASISDMGDFEDENIALIHAETEEGEYRDLLFPSWKIINSSGESETIDRMLSFYNKSDKSLKGFLKHKAMNEHDYKYDKDAFFSRVWTNLYSNRRLSATFSGIHHDSDKDRVYVCADCYDNQYISQYIVRLPECEICEIKFLESAKDFDINSLKKELQTEEIGQNLRRLALDMDVIFELAKKITDPNCTTEDLNEIRYKISGKIVRALLEVCPYCNEYMNATEDTLYTVKIPVRFFTDHDTFKVLEDEVYENVVKAVNKGKIKGECPLCGHILTAKDINPHRIGWKYPWYYDCDY